MPGWLRLKTDITNQILQKAYDRMAEKDNNTKDSFKPNFNPSKGKKPRFSFYWIYGVLLIGFIALQYSTTILRLNQLITTSLKKY